MEPLTALQLGIAFVCGLIPIFLHRRMVLLFNEVSCMATGLFLCLFPRACHHIFLEFDKIFSITLDNSHMLMSQILGAFSCMVGLTSFLTRRATDDESVLKSLMGLWSKIFCVETAASILIISKTIVSGKDGETELDLSKVPLNQLTIILVMTGVLISCIVHIIRWPIFKAQITISTDNRANLHLYIIELFFFFYGTGYLIFQEAAVLLFAPGFKYDGAIKFMTTILSANVIVFSLYIHDAQKYFNDLAKAPIFYAMIFFFITHFVEGSVYLYMLPQDVFQLIPYITFIHMAIYWSLQLMNSSLGLFCALHSKEKDD